MSIPNQHKQVLASRHAYHQQSNKQMREGRRTLTHSGHTVGIRQRQAGKGGSDALSLALFWNPLL